MSYQQFGHVDRDERIDYVDEPPPEGEPPPRRPVAGAILALGVMAIFAGGLWFAYHEGTKHATIAPEPDKVPLLRADGEPVKVKPDKAGGMDIPDKDNPIYSMRPGSPPVERLLPPPETPAPRPTAPPAQAAVPPAPLPAPAPQAPASAAKPAPLLTPDQVAALAKPPAKAAEPAAKSVAAGAGMRIQLASLRTPEEARDEWTRLKHENADLLGKLTANAVRADLGERGIYYRVEAGPVADKAAAVRLCTTLKERGLECQLVQ